MNHSIHSADRATHLKIVVVSLICAMLVAGIGLTARVSDNSAGASGRLETTVIKPAKPVTASAGDDSTVR